MLLKGFVNPLCHNFSNFIWQWWKNQHIRRRWWFLILWDEGCFCSNETQITLWKRRWDNNFCRDWRNNLANHCLWSDSSKIRFRRRGQLNIRWWRRNRTHSPLRYRWWRIFGTCRSRKRFLDWRIFLYLRIHFCIIQYKRSLFLPAIPVLCRVHWNIFRHRGCSHSASLILSLVFFSIISFDLMLLDVKTLIISCTFATSFSHFISK